MCYELATNPKGLPCNGEEWQRLREGCLEVSFVSQLSPSMLSLITSMVRPEPSERPPCDELLRAPSLGAQAMSCDYSGVVESLQQELLHKTEIVELERKMRHDAEQKKVSADQKMIDAEKKADLYWSELVQKKRQEMLREVPHAAAAVVPQPPVQNLPSPRVYRRSHTA